MKTKLGLLIILLSVFFVYENINAQAPGWLWANGAGGSDYDYGTGISSDASGNVLVTGYFHSPSITFGTTNLTNAGDDDLFVVKYDASGNVIWAKSAGGADNDDGSGISTDASGNVLATGYFYSDSITFGMTTLSNSGSSDIFIAKYDTTGNGLWAKSIGGNNQDYSSGISTDASGNVMVIGYFRSTSITFGTTILTNTNVGSSDIFIAKYDASGNVLWAKSAGGANYDYSYGISTDVSGNVLITGGFESDSMTFGTITLTNAGAKNIFVVKYDPLGNVLWAKSIEGSDIDDGVGISTDVNGNVLVTGDFYSPSITCGTIALANEGNSDVFIAKYDTSGNVLWAKSAGGTGYDYGAGISTDANGNVLVTGFFDSPSITFGTTTLTNGGNNGTPDIFILKFNAMGNTLWAKSVGGTSNDYDYGISTDVNGNILLTGGFFSPSITFGTTTLTNAGVRDFFVAKLDNITGIADASTPLSMTSVFPNPSTGQISITSSKIIDDVTITNPLGQVVYQAKLKDKKLFLQIKDDGIYFVTLTSDKKTSTGKIIVQH
ncbi:MAG: T9SS type A sorting domain-containing protein [Bacteroidia bacterium]